jgi:hypothetical protein
MKKILVAIVLLFSFAALAQEVPESERASRDEIVKFFDTMKIREQMNAVYDSIGQQMDGFISQKSQASGHNLTPQEQAKMKELMRWTVQRTREIYPMGEMLDDMIPVYQKYLSKTDLDAVVAFYSTPGGQRMLQRMPMITGEAMRTVMPKMQERMGKIETEMQAKMKELFPPPAETDRPAPVAKPKPAPPTTGKVPAKK